MKPQDTGAATLIPNVGAEEGTDWPSLQRVPAVAATVDLWRGLFAEGHGLLGGGVDRADPWPPSLGPRPENAVFPWLEGPTVQCWLADPGARALALEAGLAWSGPAPDDVLRIHDKAFAVRAGLDLDLTPADLREVGSIFDPEALTRPDWVDRLENELAGWPEWTQGRFCLKPRLGSSGRGQRVGTAARLDKPGLRAEGPTFALRGGAVLEPWLERCADFSVQIHIPDPGLAEAAPVTVLGSLELWVTPAGLYRGHLGEVDSRGRIFSGGPFEEIAREAGAALAARARDAGYHGPCGVDGLAFRRPTAGLTRGSTVVRPVVEFNARFTLGTIVIGWVRRHLERVKAELGLRSGERRAFLFALDVPPGWRDWEAFETTLDLPTHLLPLAGPSASPRPALVFGPSLETLRRAVSEDPGSRNTSSLCQRK